jgi:hypothetical protein
MMNKARIGLAVTAIAIGFLMVLSSSAVLSAPPTRSVHVGSVIVPAQVTTCMNGVSAYRYHPYGGAWGEFWGPDFWGCTLNATTWQGVHVPSGGWGENVGILSCLAVNASWTDGCDFNVNVYVHNLFGTDAGSNVSVWVTDNSTLATGWGEVGQPTPQVPSASGLVAPTYDPYWTGNGTSGAGGWFNIDVPAGVTEYIAINNGLFVLMGHLLDSPCGETTSQLLGSGCSVPGISVASGFYYGNQAVGVLYPET